MKLSDLSLGPTTRHKLRNGQLTSEPSLVDSQSAYTLYTICYKRALTGMIKNRPLKECFWSSLCYVHVGLV